MCVCVLFQVGAQVLFSLGLRGGRAHERLEKAYITVSIVTCSIVPKDVLKKYTNSKS